MIIAACLLVGTILAAYAIFAAVKYTRMISTIFMSLVYKPSEDAISFSRGEGITILDSSGHEIECLYLDKISAAKIVIFCHESGSQKESWEKYAFFIPDWGYRLLSVSFPEKNRESANNSLSQWPDEEEVERLLTVIRWAKQALGPDGRIILFGVSKGADLALCAAQKEPCVKGVVTDGLFSMKEIFRDYIRRWGPILVKPNLFGERYPQWIVDVFAALGFWHCQKRSGRTFIDIEKVLRRNKTPLLLIHGEEDDYISVSHQRFLEKLAGNRVDSRLVVPNARHNQAIVNAAPEYQEQVRVFLERLAG